MYTISVFRLCTYLFARIIWTSLIFENIQMLVRLIRVFFWYCVHLRVNMLVRH